MTRETSTGIPLVASRMKEDWNSRAQENAKWFINTVGVTQSDEEFFAGGRAELEEGWLPDFREAFRGRDLKQLRVFENGCGIGRMTSHLAEVFGEIWAVDVSGEMISQARERFSHLSNIRWLEIDGVSLEELPADYFDLGFSIYVYQHMPGKEVISRNIAGAFSRLKTGGIYKFHTNGFVRDEFEEIEKDTWVGATFPEVEIRNLAIEIGAQLIGIKGGGTQYCWTTLRKRPSTAVADRGEEKRRSLRIEMAGCAEDIERVDVPASGDSARLGLVLSGLDLEIADCNSVVVRLDDRAVQPTYVGALPSTQITSVKSRFPQDLSLLQYVELSIPEGLPGGSVAVVVEHDGLATAAFHVRLMQGEMRRPKIVTIRNGADYGTDIASSGKKSSLVLYVHALDESASAENVELRLDDVAFQPEFVGFVKEHGTWQVNAQLPGGQSPGSFDLTLSFKGCKSVAAPIVIRDPVG